jgi:hypothetical protein
MMIAAPASAGRLLHPHTVLKAPYKGSASAPNDYSSIYGCATSKPTLGKWNPSKGLISLSTSDTAKSCTALGGIGNSSTGESASGVDIGIPASVAKTGSYSFLSTWSINVSSVAKFTVGGCPAMVVNYHPALNGVSSAFCDDGFTMEFNMATEIEDVSNASWQNTNSTGYSEVDASNSSYFLNETYCSNPGKATCTNTSGTFPSSSIYSPNAAGFSAFTWNGVTKFSMWNNVTNMRSGDTYEFVVYVGLIVCAGFVSFSDLKGAWPASVSASTNMNTLGRGVTLESLTIL